MMIKKRVGLIDRMWETLEEGITKYKRVYPSIIFHREKKEEFASEFEAKYDKIKNDYMTSDTEILDSHKQAALLTICCLELNLVECSSYQVPDDELQIVPQMIAVSASLSYMLQCLNDLLEDRGIKKRISKYYFPVPIACDTKYEKCMCRILYYEQHNGLGFNVLELADRYFLLEYINLMHYGIRPELLKENEK